MNVKDDYRIIGLMSGTSCDGTDLADCAFHHEGSRWRFEILEAFTRPYQRDWERRLLGAPALSGRELCLLDLEYGRYLGEMVREYTIRTGITPDAVASHGHTIFHEPAIGLTTQIGSGAALCASSGLPVVCDFRALDVALGGQGAPLVPIGDQVLFGEYQYALNLGGFSNLSFQRDGRRIAFDICPVNIIMNMLAQQAGCEFDDRGRLAAAGKVSRNLLDALNAIPYYAGQPPKSLGREWMERAFMPHIHATNLSVADRLRTVCEHIAIQVGRQLPAPEHEMVLVTGGGAYNDFLISRIKEHTRATLVIPGEAIVNYKEALIFAFLGLLRLREETNTLATVTGARSDSSGGAVYYPVGRGAY
jgi:anhydro-N-acetylmuramic acid kinase